MNLNSSAEEKLLFFIKNVFALDSFDLNHTLLAVQIMKELISKEGGDERVLVPVMYLHDIGYVDFLDGSKTLANRLAAKKGHMITGSKKAKVFLDGTGDFSVEEIEKIVHLVSMHDKLGELKTRDELLVLEADSLAAIHPSAGKTFGIADIEKYVLHFGEKRAPRFITKTGKELLLKFMHENEWFQKFTKKYKK